jgi:long-chain fatty acid transport protein
MRVLLIATFAFALAANAATTEANPFDMFGAGARASAMGGAHTAAAEDASANYYNPALLARLPALHIDLGYRMAVPDLRLNDEDLGVDTARGTRIAWGMPGKVGAIDMGVGVSVFLPDQEVTRIRSLSETQPRFSLYDNRAQRLVFSVNFGFALTDKLSIGGGIGYLVETTGNVRLAGRVGFPDAEDSDLRLDMDVDVQTLPYPIAGVAYQVRPWLRLAASFRGGVRPVTDLSVNIEGDIGAANLEPIVADASVFMRSVSLSHFQPAEVTVGLDANVSRRLRIAADLAFHRWSAYANPAAELETELELGEFNDLLMVPPSSSLASASFHDIFIPRLGVEYLLREGETLTMQGRAGYSYEPSPAPEQVGITNFVDNDKHTTALGLGLTLRDWSSIILKPLSIDATFALTTLPGRDHQKLSAVDPIGDYRSEGSVWQFFTTSRMRF